MAVPFLSAISIPTPVAIPVPLSSASRFWFTPSEVPSNFTFAPVTVSGQSLRLSVKRVGAAFIPAAPLSAVCATLPKLTFRFCEPLSTVQVWSVMLNVNLGKVMLPVKLIVPSAAIALPAASIKHTIVIVFFIPFSLMKNHSRGLPCFTPAVKKSALDFPVSARVVSSGENLVEKESPE